MEMKKQGLKFYRFRKQNKEQTYCSKHEFLNWLKSKQSLFIIAQITMFHTKNKLSLNSLLKQEDI